MLDLQRPLLQQTTGPDDELVLVNLSSALNVRFHDVPQVQDEASLVVFPPESVTSGQVVKDLLKWLGLKKVVNMDGQTKRFDYVLRLHASGQHDTAPLLSQRSNNSGSESKSIPSSTLLLPYVRSSTAEAKPFEVVFTHANATVRDETLARPAQPASRNTWRPKSIFSLLGTETASEDDKSKDEPIPVPLASTSLSRLSTLFTDWVAPTLDSPSSKQISSPMAASTDPEEESTEDISSEALELEARLEAMMDDIGLKDAQKSAMRKLPPDRKTFLVTQHERSTQAATDSTAMRAPATTAADERRYSLNPLAWFQEAEPESRPSSTLTVKASHTGTSWAGQDPQSPITSQSTGGWTSWWSGGLGVSLTGASQQSVGQQSSDSPERYAYQIRSTRLGTEELVKTLIALRVRLSTSKVAWVAEFVRDSGGVSTLHHLMQRLLDSTVR